MQIEQVAAALAARPEGERPWDSLRRAFDVITQVDSGQPGQSLNLMRLLNDACALMTHQWEKTQGRQSMPVPEISRRLGDGSEPSDDLRAHALVASAMACLKPVVLSSAWVARDAGKAVCLGPPRPFRVT
ncbi:MULTISPECIES: hypothetical protein [Streptomyces]|uniref:Uncharacterized protein n=1 Tax=Streptomyces sp. 900129855 TaxID=3155129 RepID=A0ABV2ZS95_9ACTN